MKTTWKKLELTANLINQVNISSSKIKKRFPILSSWEVRWNNRLKTALGRCVVKKENNREIKYVEFSTKILALNSNSRTFCKHLQQNILHEWAHALDYERNNNLGHQKSWKSIMVELQAKPETFYDSEAITFVNPKAKYVIRNTCTGTVFAYYDGMPSTQQMFDFFIKVKMFEGSDGYEIIDLKKMLALKLK